MRLASFFNVSRVFAIDVRSLALFRIALGFLYLVDTIQKIFLVREFYTDWGLFPRAYWIENYMGSWKFSFHLASGDAWFQYLLLAAQLVFCLAFLAGYRARLFGFLLFVFTCSLQSRNNQILSASDELMRLLLLWCLFLPVTERFALHNPNRRNRELVEVGTFTLLMQGFSMYFFTALLKLHPVWTSEYSGVYYALHLDIFTTSLASWFRQFVQATQVLTALTIYWEFIGPVLALLVCGWARFAVSVIFLFFHLNLTLFLVLGLFPYVACAYWFLYFPTEVWETKSGKKLEAALDRFFHQLGPRLPLRVKLPRTPTARSRQVSALVGVFLFSLVTWNNLDSLKKEHVRIPYPAASLVRLLYIDQTWDMFAPYPIRNDGWFVIDGEFQDGSKLDLWSEKPATYEKPKLVSATFPNTPWRKIMVHVWDEANPRILLPFGRFLCRKFSRDNGWPSNVATFKVQFVKEHTPPIGEPFPPTEIKTLWTHDCFLK